MSVLLIIVIMLPTIEEQVVCRWPGPELKLKSEVFCINRKSGPAQSLQGLWCFLQLSSKQGGLGGVKDAVGLQVRAGSVIQYTYGMCENRTNLLMNVICIP